DGIEDTDDGFSPLHGTEVGNVDDDLGSIVSLRKPLAKFRSRTAVVNPAVEKIRDHVDVARDAKLIVGRRAQALRHRSHAIGVLNGERHTLRVEESAHTT